jgi:predicted permease
MLSRLRLRLRALFNKPEMERELGEELRFHLEKEIEQKLARGMSREQARLAALRSFGGVEQISEQCRDERGVRLFEELWQDLRYGARMFIRKPGFTLVAVITLALGIGANTAIFSVVNAVLLNPLPYPEPDRLVQVWEHYRPANEPLYSVAPINFLGWKEPNQAIEQIAAVDFPSFNLTGDGDPERIRAARVSPGLFPLLGVGAIAGRTFGPEEEQFGQHQVVMVSHGLWLRRFGSDAGLVGRTLTLNDMSYTVVGILPADFHFLAKEIELLTPMAFDSRDAGQRGTHSLRVFARLKPGVTLTQAQTEMDQVIQRVEQENPNSNTGKGVTLVPLREQLVGETRRALLILLGAVAFMLLIACANVANLLLARAATRQKEIALRRALGAGRLRIVRQLVTESGLLSALGGIAGLALAYWGVRLLVAYSPEDIPRLYEIGVDGRVLGFTIAISLATGLVFGLAPAVAASKTELNEVLKEGGRQAGGGARERRFQQAMVVGAVAVALVLLVGAGLMIQSFWRLQRVDPGFQAENLLAAELSLPPSRYRDGKQISSFHRRLLERVGALPGVRSVGGAAFLPLGGRSNEWSFEIEGRPPQPPGQRLTAGWRPVTANYFHTMGIPLITGRHFTEHDDETAPGAAIINETAARVFWAGEDPLGQRFILAKRTYSIVGVVKDVKHFRLDGEAVTEMYFPYSQLPIPWRLMTVVVRTESAPDELAAAVRAAVLEIDKDQPVYNVRTVESLLDKSVSRSRFYLLLMSAFAALALVMACLGLYGVMSYAVTQRTHEIGIRLAMGAQPRDVLRSVGGRGLMLALSGVGVGLIAAFGLTRVMTTLLYDVSPTDTLTFAAIALLLIAVALLACYLPARRATKVDPMIALRYE